MKIKSRLHIFCLVILLMLAYKPHASAVGIMASDFGWQKVGQDSFLITLTLYTDCNSSAPGNATIKFRSTSSSVYFDSLIITVPSGSEVTPVCSSIQTRCQSSSSTFPYGITKYVYSGIKRLNLAGSNCSINMIYQACCRNSSITTGSANATFSTEIMFNRCTSLTDNSPTFSNSPIKILCVGMDVTYNSGLIDQDTNSTGGAADSFTYEYYCGSGYSMYSGQFSCSTSIYFWGFPNYTLPFPRGMHLDPSTGDLQFRPMRTDVSPIQLRVNEFRNGTNIATIIREMQMITITCPSNNPPSLTTPNNVRTKSVCAGSPVSFTFTTNDPNTADTVTISWNQAIPGASWSSNNGQAKHPTATLSWTPTFSQASSLPYTFTVTVKDNACPISQYYTQAYQITVKPTPIANYSITDSGCGQYYFAAHLIRGSHVSYIWKGSGGINYNSSSFLHQFKNPGTYPFNFSYNAYGCGSGYNDTIRTDTFLWIKLPKDTTICKGTTVNLTAQSYNAIGNLHYQWSPVQGDTMPGRTFRVYSDTNIILNITDQSGCTAKDTMRVKTYLPKADAGNDTAICINDAAVLKANGGIKFQWYNGDTTASITVKPLSGRYFSVRVTDTNNCSNRDSVFVRVNALPTENAGPDRAICMNQQVTLIVIGGKSWKWNTGQTTNLIIKKPLVSTHYSVKITDSNNCSITDTVFVKVNQLPKLDAGKDQSICSQKGYHILLGQPYSSVGYWTGQAIFKDSSGFWNFDPNANGINHLGNYPLFYHYTDLNGCYNSDTIVLTVYKDSPVEAGQYVKQCINGNPLMLMGSPPGGFWIGNGVVDPIFDPQRAGLGIHQLMYIHPYLVCPNKDSTSIEVVTIPVVSASTLAGKFEFCPQGLITLTGSPAGGYFGGTWLENIEYQYYFNTNRNEGNYPVMYTFRDNNGCSNTDTIILKVSNPWLKIDTSVSKVCYNNMISLRATYHMADKILWSQDKITDGYFNGSTNDTQLFYIPGENDFGAGGFWIRLKTYSGVCITVKDSIYIKTGYNPKPDFNVDLKTGFFPLKVIFNDMSTIQNGNVTGFTWSFGDGNYSTDQNPQNTYLFAGSYDVKLIAESDFGCKDSIIKFDYITTISSLPENINSKNIRVSPNPANSFIDVSFTDKSSGIAEVFIYNASGTLIQHQNGFDQNSVRIETGNFMSGLYLLRMVSVKGEEYLAKFIKE